MADGEPGFAYAAASVLVLPFLRETGELVEEMLGGGSEGYRGCWYCWGGPPCCTAAEDMAIEGIRRCAQYGRPDCIELWVGCGVWLVQGEISPIQTVALGCIMQGR